MRVIYTAYLGLKRPKEILRATVQRAEGEVQSKMNCDYSSEDCNFIGGEVGDEGAELRGGDSSVHVVTQLQPFQSRRSLLPRLPALNGLTRPASGVSIMDWKLKTTRVWQRGAAEVEQISTPSLLDIRNK